MSWISGSTSISGVGEVIVGYDCLLVDVYGVLHDGGMAFEGVADALRNARIAGRRVIVVTNSAERVEAVTVRLRASGITEDCYDHAVSSGEMAFAWLDNHARQAGRAPRLHIIREGRGPAWLAGLPDPAGVGLDEAELVLAAGMPFEGPEDAERCGFHEDLEAARRRDLPMVVADSDVTYPSNGRVRYGPGWIADAYAGIGGQVVAFGKPHLPAFERALELGGMPLGQRTLMIGDNLETDVLGAARAGLHSLLVLRHGVSEGLDAAAIERIVARTGATPTYAAEKLVW